MLGPLCDQTDKINLFVKHNKDYKKYASLKNSHKDSHRNHMNMTFYKNIFRSINRFLHPAGCVPRTFGCLWGLVCVRDGGCRDNKSLCIN